ncbi:ABC transporter permease [Microbacterium horticulturae]|uniref:ABC transporter permease n=1 Tax=Microbacterium horticulturae TaxID=3028316 RepID=A0ABY8BWA2_9MICO|nr:ABC transporter permease [Microbacterium sp. KACC 23027]WEG08469.1 ABC transporter permease [Microbacterium sp. KACC 23027]
MPRLLGRTALQIVALLFIVTALVFALQSLVPGDAARAILGSSGDEQLYLQLREKLGLDTPLWQQYLGYWGQVFHGSLGTTLTTGVPVLQTLIDRLPITLSLVVLSVLVSGTLGVLLGVAAARGRRWTRTLADVASLAGTAFPNFWLAILLILGFAVAIPLFPATGYADFTDSPADWARSLVLPVIALSVGGVGLIAKTTRDGMLRALHSDFARTLRANGVTERRVVWAHALKNSALLVLPALSVSFIASLGGAVLIENVFALNGLGSLVVSAVAAHEIYQVLGVAILFTVIVGIVNLLVDVMHGLFDPRLRGGAS